MVRRCVWSRNLVNEDAMAHWWASRRSKKNVKEVIEIPSFGFHLTNKQEEVFEVKRADGK